MIETSSHNVLRVFPEAVRSAFTGLPQAHSSGLGSVGPVGMRTTQQLSSRSLQSGKIEVGLEHWGLGRGELLLNRPVQEEAGTAAQSSPGAIGNLGAETRTLCWAAFQGSALGRRALGSGLWRPEAKMQTAWQGLRRERGRVLRKELGRGWLKGLLNRGQ